MRPTTANPRKCDGIIASIKNQLSGLGLNPANVTVRVTQDGWTNASACGSTFQSSTFGSAKDNVPCVGSFDTATNTARGLVVEVKYPSSILLALPPFPTTITLTSKAVYRCEFSF